MGQTKNDIITESSNVIAAHVTDLQSDIPAVCSELISECGEPLEYQRVVDARIVAVEDLIRAHPASAPETLSKSSLAVVGGFGSLTRDAAIVKVVAALAETLGFVQIIRKVL